MACVFLPCAIEINSFGRYFSFCFQMYLFIFIQRFVWVISTKLYPTDAAVEQNSSTGCGGQVIMLRFFHALRHVFFYQ